MCVCSSFFVVSLFSLQVRTKFVQTAEKNRHNLEVQFFALIFFFTLWIGRCICEKETLIMTDRCMASLFFFSSRWFWIIFRLKAGFSRWIGLSVEKAIWLFSTALFFFSTALFFFRRLYFFLELPVIVRETIEKIVFNFSKPFQFFRSWKIRKNCFFSFSLELFLARLSGKPSFFFQSASHFFQNNFIFCEALLFFENFLSFFFVFLHTLVEKWIFDFHKNFFHKENFFLTKIFQIWIFFSWKIVKFTFFLEKFSKSGNWNACDLRKNEKCRKKFQFFQKKVKNIDFFRKKFDKMHFFVIIRTGNYDLTFKIPKFSNSFFRTICTKKCSFLRFFDKNDGSRHMNF